MNNPTTTSSPRLLRMTDVMQKINLSRSTITRLIGNGKFPKPIKLSPHITRWIESEIDAWAICRIASYRDIDIC